MIMINTVNEEMYNDIIASTNLITGEDYRNIVYNISKFASQMVVKTLGPYGSTTIIDDATFTYPSKDGWSCLNKLHFNDPIYDSIFKTLKQISFSIVNKVGDGTTSALIGANAFLDEVLKYQESNEFRQVDFLNTLEKIKDQVIDRLMNGDEIHQIDKSGDFSDIRRIAYISSNSNDKLSDMIQDIYQKTQNPNIYVTIDPGPELTSEVQTGYRFECTTLNHKVYINNDNGTCRLANNDVLIALFNHNITYNEHAELITLLSRYASAMNKTIIIAAPYFDDVMTNVIGTSVNSMLQSNRVPNILMMQIPLSMDIHRKYLSDLVMLTNAQIFDIGKVRAVYAMVHNQENPTDQVEQDLLDAPSYNFESPTDLFNSCLGHINTIVIDKTYAVLQDYDTVVNKTIYNNTLAEVRNDYEMLKEKANKSDSVLNKEFMDANQRYVKLIGKMGIINVGGASELEKHCVKDSVDDAVLACRSAYDHGYIRGLNLATLKIISDLMAEHLEKSLEHDVINMLYDVFYTTTISVLCNKYMCDEYRMVEIASAEDSLTPVKMNLTNEQIIDYCLKNDMDYNLVTEKLNFADNLTVINSVSTDIEILKAIIGTLSMMLTSTQFLSTNRIYNKKMTRTQVVNQKTEDMQKLASGIIDVVLEKLNGSDISISIN